MRIIVMNKIVRDKIRGTFFAYKGIDREKLEPWQVANDVYIIGLDSIIRAKPHLKDSKYADVLKENVTSFVMGDGSLLDQKYQTYLLNNQIE